MYTRMILKNFEGKESVSKDFAQRGKKESQDFEGIKENLRQKIA